MCKRKGKNKKGQSKNSTRSDVRFEVQVHWVLKDGEPFEKIRSSGNNRLMIRDGCWYSVRVSTLRLILIHSLDTSSVQVGVLVVEDSLNEVSSLCLHSFRLDHGPEYFVPTILSYTCSFVPLC